MNKSDRVTTSCLIIFLLLSAGILQFGCGEELPGGDSFELYGITGFIKDRQTDLAVDSAWIDLADAAVPHSAYTDTAGYYMIILPEDTLIEGCIHCGKEGYVTYDTFITLQITNPNTNRLDLFLIPQ
jgi:hypothetical protein